MQKGRLGCQLKVQVMHAQSLQLCPTLCSPMDHSPPGSSVHGVLQARILEWIVISYSRGSSWSRNWTRLSYVSCRQAGSLPLAPPGKLTSKSIMAWTMSGAGRRCYEVSFDVQIIWWHVVWQKDRNQKGYRFGVLSKGKMVVSHIKLGIPWRKNKLWLEFVVEFCGHVWMDLSSLERL